MTDKIHTFLAHKWKKKKKANLPWGWYKITYWSTWKPEYETATKKGENPALFTDVMEIILNLKLALLQESTRQIFQQNIAISFSATFFLCWSLLKVNRTFRHLHYYLHYLIKLIKSAPTYSVQKNVAKIDFLHPSFFSFLRTPLSAPADFNRRPSSSGLHTSRGCWEKMCYFPPFHEEDTESLRCASSHYCQSSCHTQPARERGKPSIRHIARRGNMGKHTHTSE